MRFRSQRSKSALVPIISLFILLAISLIITQSSNGIETLPRVTVILYEKFHDAYVHPDMTGIVTIVGVVRVEDPWPEDYSDIKVILSIDAGGWEYEVPEEIELTEVLSSKNFTVTLYVPLETSHSTQASITIAGNWVSESKDRSGLVIPDTATIRIKQYYQFSVSGEENFGSIKCGEKQGFLCRLINEGNGHDRIRLEIVNLDNLTQNGINVTLSQDKFQVPEKQERDFTIEINTSALTVPGNYSIRIRALSAQAEGIGEVGYIFDKELLVDIAPNEVSTDETPFPEIHFLLAILIAISLFVFIKNRRFNRI